MSSISVSAEVRVNAPSDRVFAYLTNLDTHMYWNTGMKTISRSGPLAEGMTYETSSVVMGRTVLAKNTVTKLVPGRELVLVNQTMPLAYVADMLVEPVGPSEALLRCRLEVRGELTFFRLAAPLLEYLASSQVEGDLNALRILVENEVAERTINT